MPSNDDLLLNYREMVAAMRGNIALFETRHMTLYGDRGGERVDITQEWKFRMKLQTRKLQQVIDDLEGLSPGTLEHEPSMAAHRSERINGHQ